jgi:crotonobetainyl-CoA:carnitine CoA-transferase CaiB-like acyl-CoA transferase
MTGRIATRTGARGLIPIDLPGIGIFPAKDGNVFCYLGTPGGAPWTTMVDWMQREGKAEDLLEGENLEMVQGLNLAFLSQLVREPDKLPARIKVLSHMRDVFARFVASYSKWYIYEEAQKQRLMIGIVSTPEDLAKNPQLEARKWYQDVPHDADGHTVRLAGPPYHLSATPPSIRQRAPLPGEHNAEIFEELGMAASELEKLASAKIV